MSVKVSLPTTIPRFSALGRGRLSLARRPTKFPRSAQRECSTVSATANSEGVHLAVMKVREHLRRVGKCDLLQATAEVNEAVKSLVESGSAGGLAAESLTKGAGVWEVFYMPHIRTIAEPLGLSFCPLRYTITEDGQIVSDVRYKVPVVGQGWLSSSGTVRLQNEDDIELRFDKFWIGGADVDQTKPRPNPEAEASSVQARSTVDNLINVVGNAAFLEDLGSFPVLFFSDEADICIFKFPPLNSAIAAYRVSSNLYKDIEQTW
mmetsp:Transcript_19062/g.36417  ORF Transcript_19062/g.36417 Transcript_19062/m.36417 type:complete len:263 (+) Transcript_19062:79-867(+)|eukprot:CAMPEP_0114229784 /NCGR_PEP_ID=MMETSP0058-20121206/3103_1 /TAXON_ID=36894 /ORGANISM="Pyramimonas parkeae, CCMP726" /LENGTH=262 /DNA_ID=CAMNT_0001340905 /DNA_START=73 /DNA_END=861 /DNA_ORIENTATION=-